jgi:hypothetical protein
LKRERWMTFLGIQHLSEAPRLWLIRALAARPATTAALATAAFLLFQAATAFAPSSVPFAYAAWVEDDAFYYTEIARNIAETGRSTFDGVTLSNGYHPAWMLVCVALARIFPLQSPEFFMALFAVQAVLVLAGVAVFARLLREPTLSNIITPAAIAPAATLYGVFGVLIAATGMEVALLWPLLPAFGICIGAVVARPNLKTALAATFCASMCVLARLDSGVVIAPLAIAAVLIVAHRIGLARLLRLWPAALGLAPVVIYLAINAVIFGAATPLSGAAKRLFVDGAGPALALRPLAAFVQVHNANYLFVPVAATLLSIAALIWSLNAMRKGLSAAAIGILLLSIGVFGFYLQTAVTSEWSLWLWYFYAVCFLGAIGAAIAASRAAVRVGSAAPIASILLVGAILVGALGANAYRLRHPPSETNALFLRAIPVMEFARTHPGRYAMGDGAGAVAFMLDQPLVQLEGLVNDKMMLDDIRAQGRIADSLRRQKVDYYVVGDQPGQHEPNAAGCVDLTEPLQAGPRSARMRERVCSAPALQATTQWLRTRVWDVRAGVF